MQHRPPGAACALVRRGPTEGVIRADLGLRATGEAIFAAMVGAARSRKATFQPQNLHLYRQSGLWPHFLTAITAKPVEPSATREVEWHGFSELPLGDCDACLDECRALTAASEDTLFAQRGLVERGPDGEDYGVLSAALAAAATLALGAPAAPPVHRGDLVLSGTDTLTVTGDYRQIGDILLSGDAVLTIRNGTFTVDRRAGDPRADIVLSDRARLLVANAALVPPLEHPDNLYLTALDNAHVELASATFINVINLVDRARLDAIGSAVFSSAPAIGIPETAGAFGIVQACCEVAVTLTDTTVGSIGLFFGAGEVASLDDLAPGRYTDWRLSDHLGAGSTVGYEVVLRNSRVLPVRLEGPFERGWTIFTSPLARLRVSGSTLNKLVFQEFVGQTLEFSGLRLDTPATLDHADVHVATTTITNQWGFFGRDSSITIRDSRGLWLWPSGTGGWRLVRSTMNEYDPRGFTGTLRFESATWRVAGEIFEGSDHVIEGTVRFRAGIDRHLVIDDSTITRRIPVRVVDRQGRPLGEVLVRLKRGGRTWSARTDSAGAAVLELPFDERSLRKPFTLTEQGTSRPATFFTDTPITLRLG